MRPIAFKKLNAINRNMDRFQLNYGSSRGLQEAYDYLVGAARTIDLWLVHETDIDMIIDEVREVSEDLRRMREIPAPWAFFMCEIFSVYIDELRFRADYLS